jgi:hypothetical protein
MAEEGGAMISDESIDWTVKVLENSQTSRFAKQAARDLIDAWLKQEQQTFQFEYYCYRRSPCAWKSAAFRPDAEI